MPLKTRQQVRDEFAHQGLSFSAWAKQRSYSAALVCAILNDDQAKPARKCLRGESHNIAVDLGLKVGVKTASVTSSTAFRSSASPRMAAAA
ncbi:DNA-binding protein [Acidovorax sp.]|uniref:DNA-binding protein n=1 Tax=Acidovorax sp. TaxID=1872122 RepID=UPI002ACDB913|nr:DNA-binding protein [Acidovorax sp.]MDZ7862652.1 DNA-binding protein [Acidovorax sp.]